jgi:putative DNA primase/helicase
MTNEPSKAEHDIDRSAEIERLAALEPVDYEIARVEAANRLRIRASILDREVKKKRRALGFETDKDDKGQGRAVKIVDVLPWQEPVDGEMLATVLTCAIKTYVVIREEAADAIAFWVLHTWLANDFRISPRLALTSPTKGCGKTTVLQLLNLLVRRPKRAGSISPPALFRAVEKYQPTLLLDENEKYLEVGSDFHALLNEGHAKGATVLRVLGEKLELREFCVFGAVAFARNGKLPDDLEQRSIVIELHRRMADEPICQLLPERCESLQRVARMAARWSEDHRADLVDANPDMGILINRIADNWRPLFAIADFIGGEWPARVRDAAMALAPREADSIGTTLLADIKATFEEKQADRLSSTDMCEALIALEGRPWAEWKAGKALTPNQLARLLKPFHVISDTIRVGSKVAKGYYRHHFEEAFQRYLAALGVYETLQRNKPTATGTSAPFQNVTSEAGVTFRKHEKPLRPSDCYGVTFQKGENGLEVISGQGDGPEQPADDLKIPEFLRRLTADERDRFEERAAIREIDGGETREEAEAGATKDLLSSPDFSSAMSSEKR